MGVGASVVVHGNEVTIRDCTMSGAHMGVCQPDEVAVPERGSPRPIGGANRTSRGLTVEHCEFSGYPSYQWVHRNQKYWDGLYHTNLAAVFMNYGGPRSILRHNWLYECSDGLQPRGNGTHSPADASEIAYNLIQNCGDDSIEFDSTTPMNLRVHHNVILEGQCLLGLSPVQRGGVTIEHNIVYASPEYGIPWSVIFKFSTPSANAFWRGGFNPLSGMTIRNNTLVNAKSGISWGTTSKHGPYFKDNTVANNIIYGRDWDFCSGLPWKEGLAIEKNNLCVGPAIVAGKHAPEGVLCTRSKEPFVKQDTYFCDVMPPSLPGLVGEEELGEEKEISRVKFAVSEEYVRAAIKECGFAEGEYKDVYKNLGAIPPGTKWEFPRPGPRWAVGESALFRPPLPPSLDPWWVGFSDKPSDAKTVKIRPWRGKFYKKFENFRD